LEDEADIVAAEGGEAAFPGPNEVEAVDGEGAGCGAVHAAEQVEEGGFTAARWAEDDGE
jgi:hypothetical protein